MSITRIGTYSQIKGSSISLPCKAATTTNITLSGAQTIDGVSVVAGDRVLVKDQNTGSQNGIYIASAGAWSRAVDMSLDDDLIQGTLVLINSGNLYQGELFILTTANPMTIGVTALTFTQFTFVNGSSGTSGTNGSSGTSGTKGTSGTSGANGSSGTAGTSGTSGSSGTGGTSGSSGTAGTSGTSGSSGTSGTSGSSGTTGTSGTVGTSGTTGSSGTSGTRGTSGTSGTNGSSGTVGTSGTSGSSGTSGTSGANGANGSSGTSGTKGTSGTSGTSGTAGTSGEKGADGSSGTSGANGGNGSSGTSGVSGANGSSGTSGANGAAGSSGTSGAGTISGTLNYIAKFTPNTTTVGDSVMSESGGNIIINSGGDLELTPASSGTNAILYNDVGILESSNSFRLRSGSTLYLNDSTNVNNWQIYNYTDFTLRFNYNGAGNDEIIINNAGYVGIGGDPTSIAFVYITNGNSTYTVPQASNVPQVYVYNSNSTTGTAHAILTLRTNGANSGDPFISMDINGVIGWSMGVDNSDSDKFKIANDWSNINSSTALTIATSTLAVTLAGALSGTSATFSGDLTIDTNTLYVDSTNNRVGVGTTSPSYKLEVSGSGNFINIIGASSGDVATGFRIGRGASLGAEIYDNPQDNITTLNTTGGLNLRVGGSNRLTIASTGAATFTNNIITTGATAEIMANGSGSSNSVGGSSRFTILDSSNNRGWILQQNASYNLSFWHNNSGWSNVINFTPTGAATFSSSVTAGGIIYSTSGGVDGTFVDSLVARYSGNTAEQNAIQTAVSSVAGGSGFRFMVSDGGGSSARTNTVDFLRDKAIFNTNVGIGTSPSYKLHISGGKTIISSTDSSYGQLQIGNTTNASSSEAAILFIGSATAFGTPTSAQGNGQIWVAGAGIYGMASTIWGVGNVSYNNPIFTIASDGKCAIGRTITASDVLLGVYSSGSTYTSPVNNNIACVAAINSNNTSGDAHALLTLRSGGSSGGDAFISMDIANEDGWSMGVDNSDGNKFKIANNWSTIASSTRFTMEVGGNATFTGTLTANSFFETSDARLKTLIDKEIDYQSILNIETRYYKKGDREELGYFAQDVEQLLGSAISKRDDGYLNLSYRQVHTAKIAALEAKIKQLEEQLKNK